MRLAGGSGSGGLKGISPRCGRILRPLISCGKQEILAYLASLSIPFANDSSNASDDYRRNRVRHHIVPALDLSLPGWRSGCRLSSVKSALDEEAFGLLAARSPGKFLECGPKTREADYCAFFTEPEALRIRMLLSAAGDMCGRSRLSWRMAKEAIRILGTEAKFFQGGGFSLSSLRGKLFLKYGLDFPRRGGYFVQVLGPGMYTTGRIRIRISWQQTSRAAGLSEGTFSFPFVLRSRLPGDCIHSTGGMKKLDELFSEWKVPPGLRDAIPVIEDRAGIVAVLGRYAGVHDRFRAPNPKGVGRVLSIVMKGARVSDGF
jgi:tRNA(Ile)-lysidine synthase